MTQQQDAQTLVMRADQEGVATLTLNAPQKINALSDAMLSALQGRLMGLAQDRSVRAVILRGAGPHFCAGHDLKEMTAARTAPDGGASYYRDLFARCSRVMMAIERLPQPVIAEVSGIATAAGCQLVASCDLAVASQEARFATSGVNIGLFCATPMVAVSRRVARKHAMELLLLGEFISAKRAVEIGFINREVALDQLSAETARIARQIADKSSAAVALGKEAFGVQAEMSMVDAYAYAGEVMTKNMMCQDAEAGIGAFVCKAEMPPWTGK